MARARVFRRPLVVFLAMAVVVQFVALAQRSAPRDLAAVVAALRDGDLERDERVELLGRLVALGAGGDRPAALRAALAGIALDDEPTVLRFAPEGLLTFVAADLPMLADLGFGDEVVDAVVAARSAELRGANDEARRRYTQAMQSGSLFGMQVAQELCRTALARLR